MAHTKIYAFIAEGEGEGIVAFGHPDVGITPLVTLGESDAVMTMMRRRAKDIAEITGKKINLVEFTSPVVRETFEP
jgi:hypothetical protein